MHYEGFDIYINVKELSGNNEMKILAAKLVRQQLGGANFHLKECKGIPDTKDKTHICDTV